MRKHGYQHNSSDIVHPSDSDDSDYQYEVQNLAQQVIRFIDNNNVPSSDNESLNNDSSDNESVDSENGQNEIENCVQIPIQTTSEIQNMKQILKWDGNGYFIWTLGPVSKEMLLMDWEKNEPHHFFEAFFEAEMWNYIAHETNKYAETRITQRHK